MKILFPVFLYYTWFGNLQQKQYKSGWNIGKKSWHTIGVCGGDALDAASVDAAALNATAAAATAAASYPNWPNLAFALSMKIFFPAFLHYTWFGNLQQKQYESGWNIGKKSCHTIGICGGCCYVACTINCSRFYYTANEMARRQNPGSGKVDWGVTDMGLCVD